MIRITTSLGNDFSSHSAAAATQIGVKEISKEVERRK
jgi:hypothetical protein